MIQALNNRNNTQFGTGLPIYKKLDHQTRFNTTRPYRVGLLECPIQRIPTFQFKVAEDIDKVELFDKDDNQVLVFTIGSDETFDFIKRPTSDGEFLIICCDYPIQQTLEGVYHLRFGLVSEVGVYRYFSDEFWRKANPCTLNNPLVP